MKRVLAANFLDAFAISATGMILPLLLLHRNMELGMVGAIISSLPLIYTVLRTALASVAESFGYKAYFVLSSACCAVSPIIYMLSSSPAGFLAGRAVDSLKQASIWAVNRNAVMADTPPTDFARATSRLVSIRYAAIALGAVGGGYILNTLGFDYSFLFLSAVGAAGLYVAIGMRQHRAGIGGLDFGKIRDSFNLFGRGKLFTLTTIVMLFEASMDGLINLFVIPVFLKSIGLDYTSIGLVIGAYFVVVSVALFACSRFKLSMRVLGALGILLLAGPALMLTNSPASVAPFLLLLLAAGDGIGSYFWEHIIVNAVKRSKTQAADIGTLHIIPNVASFAIVFAFGFIVQAYGFSPAFAVAAVLHTIFILGAFILIKLHKEGRL